jgi:uncharacterized LabA/DUF88 family protein
MAHNVGVFVDVSNLFYSAKSAGVEVNYCRLLEHAVAGRDLIRASAYTGVDPENPNQRKFIDFLKANGYKVICKDIHKYEGGRIKANLDIEMAVDILLLSENLDVVVIVSGDGDFVRLVEAIQMKGVRCEIISFGISTSNELIEAADQFTEICSLTGIFRNAPSGPGMHLRSVPPSEGRGMYAYSAYTITTSYGLPVERLSGEKERERRSTGERSSPQYIEERDARQHASHEESESGHAGSYQGQAIAYDHATDDDFTLPDADPCADTHSVPLARPAASAKHTDGHE